MFRAIKEWWGWTGFILPIAIVLLIVFGSYWAYSILYARGAFSDEPIPKTYLIDGKMRIITKYQQQGVPLVFFGSGKLYSKEGVLCLEGNKLSDLFMVDANEITDKDGKKRIVYSFPRRKDNDFNREVGIGDVIFISDGEIAQADPIVELPKETGKR